jgi:acyl-CoA thioester hydrolase
MPDARAPITRRADYGAFHPITTRWLDNDALGHVNNVTYYSFFDTAVTAWLLTHGLIGLREGPLWVVAETGCRFLKEVAFPDPIDIGLRVSRIGASSVRYELGVFRGLDDQVSAQGHFTHVHVSRTDRRPSPIPEAIRLRLSELQR